MELVRAILMDIEEFVCASQHRIPTWCLARDRSLFMRTQTQQEIKAGIPQPDLLTFLLHLIPAPATFSKNVRNFRFEQ